MGHFFAGDDVRDFAGFGFHGDGFRFDGDAFLVIADFEFYVGTQTIADLQGDVVLFENFKACYFGFKAIVADT